MGLFDKKDKKPYGGPFDFNRDGKTDMAEMWVAYKMYEKFVENKENKRKSNLNLNLNLDYYESFESPDPYEWRLYCEDGSEYGIAPEDYETEEEYEEALNEAKCDWQDYCEDESEYGIAPEDYETEEDYYPNKRRYNAAYTLENGLFIYINDDYEKQKKAACRFILDNADTILAANYLSHDSGFLYAQAIKDNFSIPCSLPDEDETREMEFSAILCKLAKRDAPLSFEVWRWCLEQFLPYAEYDDFCGRALSVEVIDDLYCFPDGYKTKLVNYMNDNERFCQAIMTASCEPAHRTPEVIAEAIKEKLYKTADILFKIELIKADDEWKKINALTEGVLLWCKNYEERESMEYFRDNLLPLVKAIPIGMVQDEITEWEKDIAEYIDLVERQHERKERIKKKQPADRSDMQEYANDKTVYTYCGVLLPFSSRPYSFRTEDKTLRIGDVVIVPIGEDDQEMKGTVVSVGQYARLGVPYPVEKTKMILKKAEEK